MRKNGVNKQLNAIAGGVCAPAGFFAGAIDCAFNAEFVSRETKNSLALIMADKRSVIACVYTTAGKVGAPSKVTKRHVRSGYAKAVIINSGVANVFGESAEKKAVEICRTIAKTAKICPDEVAIASTGKIGERFPVERIIENIPQVYANLSIDGSTRCAQAIGTEGRNGKEFSYMFEIGDVACKIGGIFKGGKRICPNMATTLCILTTDVAISPEMLQKALRFSVNETLNLLNVDDVPSPNDFVCILSSGRAGNYKIESADSDYEKFLYALTETMRRISMCLAEDSVGVKKVIKCVVSGARSKRSARLTAKKIVSSKAIQKGFLESRIEVEDILFSAQSENETISIERAEIKLIGAKEIVVYEEGKTLAFSQETAMEQLGGAKIEITIDLKDGNYGATSIGCCL